MLQDDAAQASQLSPLCAEAHGTAAHLNLLTAHWHANTALSMEEGAPLEILHRANFDLWHLEDRARDRSSDAVVAEMKRSIDRVNQLRNDMAERMDELLLAQLATQGLPSLQAPLHSETPGQMLDRLSILSLKLFHTAEEAVRSGATREHHEWNGARLGLLQEQQDDLAECLAQLWADILQGRRRFKQYRQLKMYNDPQLNPVLYAQVTSTARQ